VFHPALVALETQTLTWIHNDALHLVVRLICIDLVVTPGTMIFF
jgi:hypothetical protein